MHMNIPYDRPGEWHPAGGTGWEQPMAQMAGGCLRPVALDRGRPGGRAQHPTAGAGKGEVAN